MKKTIFLIGITLSALAFAGCAEKVSENNINSQISTTSLEKNIQAVSGYSLGLIASGLNSPVVFAYPEDGSNRIFIATQDGIIRIIDKNGQLLQTPFLDLRSKIVELNKNYDERGLLGLAFHPDFKNNGKFYVYYSAPIRQSMYSSGDHTNYIKEFKVSSTNPDIADLSTEREILAVDWPYSNHNGGNIKFGPDGYLYAGLGDGGNKNDVGNGHSDIGNGQDKTNLLGSIIRIDVNNGDNYSIPQDNPLFGQTGRWEIFAYGFRNPFSFSFDKTTGKLFAGDVGQGRYEEIDIVQKGGNYGWNIKEGNHCFDPQNEKNNPPSCASIDLSGNNLINPIIEYKNSAIDGGIGQSVIGGYIYRGKEIDSLQGKYIFGDWNTNFGDTKGAIFIASENSGKWEVVKSDIKLNENILGFGEDWNGEIYVLTSGGNLYKLKNG